MSNQVNILVLTSGGDAPGMNAAIRAAVRTALHHDINIFGAENGYEGLIHNRIKPLTADCVGNCIQRGGTVLKTARSMAFHDKQYRDQAKEHLKQHNIDAIIVLGGNGSFQGAQKLRQEGGPACIGIPCTIDNDIVGTEYTIGFDTACSTALKSIDKIRDTASSLERNFIIEVMGRASGFLAVDVGIAGGAEVILIPEHPVSTETLVDKLKSRSREKLSSIIVAAESNKPGYSFDLAKSIHDLSGIHYTVCVLGHTQRGGSPTAMDRKIASTMGACAVRALLDGERNKMVAMQHGKITLTDFPDPNNATRYFDDLDLLRLNEIICF